MKIFRWFSAVLSAYATVLTTAVAMQGRDIIEFGVVGGIMAGMAFLAVMAVTEKPKKRAHRRKPTMQEKYGKCTVVTLDRETWGRKQHD